jgi:hypothetical protein
MIVGYDQTQSPGFQSFRTSSEGQPIYADKLLLDQEASDVSR